MGMGVENGEEDAVQLMIVTKGGGDGVGMEMEMMKKTGRNVQELATVMGDLVVDVANAIRCGGDGGGGGEQSSIVERTQEAMQLHTPQLKQVTHRIGADAVQWMHQGGLWRSVVVMTVGLISVTTLTGLTAFLMAVLLATVNVVIIAFFMCLSAVGAFLAMFCTSLAFIYIGTVAATAFAIGSAVFMASCAVLFFSGWILFAWAICEVIKKSWNLVGGTLPSSSKKP